MNYIYIWSTQFLTGMKNIYSISLLFILLSFFTHVLAQTEPTQTIRGKVIDKDSQITLPGVSILVIQDGKTVKGQSTDIDGYFRLDAIPVGRYTISVSCMGYQQFVANDIIVNSGKEVILDIKLEGSVEVLNDVEVTSSNKGETMNKMVSVSARAFSVEESERYAGSRGDPARMSSNFAGCLGVDDSRNDIVVRGNSPLSVIYVVEGVEIPNPNHFGISGTAGGPVSILNNKVLANSDFFTGAFPASFGNSTSCVLDIKMRNGNNEKHELTAQLGFLGTELTAEGPISKKHHSSYLFNYRYSTLSLFSFMGIKLGTSAVPKYQDLSFKLNFPLKNNSYFSIFGIGGKSNIDIMISKQKVDEIDIYGETNKDQHFSTNMGTVGLNYTKSFNANTFAKITVATAIDQQNSKYEHIYRALDTSGYFVINNNEYIIDSIVDFHDFHFKTSRITAAAYINKKIKTAHVLNFGVHATEYMFNYIDSLHNLNTANDWFYRWDYVGNAALIQPYVQWKYKISDKLVLNTGLHSQYFTLNNSFSGIEPRIGIRWNISNKQTLSAGIGMHSQIQPLYTYFYRKYLSDGSFVLHNFNMGFTKSTHYIVSYDRPVLKNARIKIEAYYQQLSDIPVEVKSSSFSMANAGSGYTRLFPDSLENKGTGKNYGVEFTLEKFFSKKYFFMITASLYESKYKGSDNIERDTDFNGNFILNLLGSKEFKTGEKSSLTLGTKITTAGNKRYGPIDSLQTEMTGEVVYLDKTRNSLQFDDYFRADLQINFKINAKKVTHTIGFDIVNIFDTKNVLTLTYGPNPNNPSENTVSEEPQLGRLPLFYYRIDF